VVTRDVLDLLTVDDLLKFSVSIEDGFSVRFRPGQKW
jgi:hypothetical protein